MASTWRLDRNRGLGLQASVSCDVQRPRPNAYADYPCRSRAWPHTVCRKWSARRGSLRCRPVGDPEWRKFRLQISSPLHQCSSPSLLTQLGFEVYNKGGSPGNPFSVVAHAVPDAGHREAVPHGRLGSALRLFRSSSLSSGLCRKDEVLEEAMWWAQQLTLADTDVFRSCSTAHE